MGKYIALIVIVLLLSISNCYGQRVKFAIGEWQPYTGETIENYGLASEIVLAACNATGLKASFEFFPWKRAENNVIEESHFGTFPYKKTKERELIFYFSDSLFSSSDAILLYKLNDHTKNFTYTNPNDLKGYRVGTILGSEVVIQSLKLKNITVEEVSTTLQNIKKLENDRIDFCIDDKAVILQTLKSKYNPKKLSNFVFTSKNYTAPTPYYIMVSKEYPNAIDLINRFNEGLKKIKQNGVYSKILSKYGL
jgi:polar amino acid transport system substrate-binding protein